MNRVNHSFDFAARYLLSLCAIFFGTFPVVAQNNPTREDLAEKYRQVNEERILFQNKTKKYISMDESYKHCLSRSATAALCEDSLTQVKDQIDRTNALIVPTPLPSPLPNPDISVEQNTNIFVGRSYFFTPVPNRIFTPTEIPVPTRNQFTPRPGFTPQNRFQGGDGFNQ